MWLEPLWWVQMLHALLNTSSTALSKVYGDTDSVFVNTKTADFQQARNMCCAWTRSDEISFEPATGYADRRTNQKICEQEARRQVTASACFRESRRMSHNQYRTMSYRYKRLEIEIDGVFAGISVFPAVEVHAVLCPVIFAKVRLMLLKKKKYAAMKAGTRFNFVWQKGGSALSTWQVVDWQKQLFETEFKGKLFKCN